MLVMVVGGGGSVVVLLVLLATDDDNCGLRGCHRGRHWERPVEIRFEVHFGYVVPEWIQPVVGRVGRPTHGLHRQIQRRLAFRSLEPQLGRFVFLARFHRLLKEKRVDIMINVSIRKNIPSYSDYNINSV